MLIQLKKSPQQKLDHNCYPFDQLAVQTTEEVDDVADPFVSSLRFPPDQQRFVKDPLSKFTSLFPFAEPGS